MWSHLQCLVQTLRAPTFEPDLGPSSALLSATASLFADQVLGLASFIPGFGAKAKHEIVSKAEVSRAGQQLPFGRAANFEQLQKLKRNPQVTKLQRAVEAVVSQVSLPCRRHVARLRP